MACSKASSGLKKVRFSRRPQRRQKAQKRQQQEQKRLLAQSVLDRDDRRIGLSTWQQRRVTLSQLIVPRPSNSAQKDGGEVKIQQKQKTKAKAEKKLEAEKKSGNAKEVEQQRTNECKAKVAQKEEEKQGNRKEAEMQKGGGKKPEEKEKQPKKNVKAGKNEGNEKMERRRTEEKQPGNGAKGGGGNEKKQKGKEESREQRGKATEPEEKHQEIKEEEERHPDKKKLGQEETITEAESKEEKPAEEKEKHREKPEEAMALSSEEMKDKKHAEEVKNNSKGPLQQEMTGEAKSGPNTELASPVPTTPAHAQEAGPIGQEPVGQAEPQQMAQANGQPPLGGCGPGEDQQREKAGKRAKGEQEGRGQKNAGKAHSNGTCPLDGENEVKMQKENGNQPKKVASNGSQLAENGQSKVAQKEKNGEMEGESTLEDLPKGQIKTVDQKQEQKAECREGKGCSELAQNGSLSIEIDGQAKKGGPAKADIPTAGGTAMLTPLSIDTWSTAQAMQDGNGTADEEGPLTKCSVDSGVEISNGGQLGDGTTRTCQSSGSTNDVEQEEEAKARHGSPFEVGRNVKRIYEFVDQVTDRMETKSLVVNNELVAPLLQPIKVEPLNLERIHLVERKREKKPRQYKLLETDIQYCQYMEAKYGQDYEAMARDSRNAFGDSAKSLERKLRIYKDFLKQQGSAV